MINFSSNTVQVHIAAYFEEYEAYKYLVLKRSQNVKQYPKIWQVITGTIKGNETAVQTAIRETKEEIGAIPLKMWTLPYVTHYFNPKTNCIHASPVFGILIDSNHKIKLSKEHDNFDWLHPYVALEKLDLPSYREATQIFHEFILSKEDQSLFELKWNEYIH